MITVDRFDHSQSITDRGSNQPTLPPCRWGTQNMSQDGAQGRYAGRAVAGGRYQLRDLLGEGGMASVHLAYDSVLDRQVAIKTLHTELGREQAFRERFRREAQSVAKLTHTNIVSVFDTGEDNLNGMTTPYIVMEYIEGKPLGSVLDADIQQYGAMPADKALKITADVLAALEISHEMGLVHRDIKPGNVMMTKRNVVKVMDFGIARAMQSGVTSMTQTGMVVGTPQYLSPNRRSAEAWTPAPTCTRSASCCSNWSPDGCRSRRTHRWPSRTRTSRRSRSRPPRSTARCRRPWTR